MMDKPQTRNSKPENGHAIFSPLVERATELAAEWHDRTYRKGRWRAPAFAHPGEAGVRVPTMAHLTTVALTVQRAGWPETVVAAAFLHDILEDASAHDARFERDVLREAVGAEVTRLVEAVTEQKRDAEGRPRSWRARKEGYVAHLRDEAPPGAVAISLADKLHNLWTMCSGLEAGAEIFADGPQRTGLSAGPQQQQWFHRAVLAASRHAHDARLVSLRERLEEELERFERMTSSV